jgi:hypothetical protein
MNKNLIFIVIALIVAGGIGYKLMSKPSPVTQPAVVSSVSSKNHLKSSLKQLMAMGKSASCELSADLDQGILSGKINISGQKMMGDFKMNDSDGKMIDSHMINDGESTYVWSSAAPQGTKIKNDAVASSKSSGEQNNLDQDKEVDMDCSDWTPAPGSFNPPSDVDFIDMSSMMKGIIKEKSEESVGTEKSICDAVTDPQAKAICLQQMGN